MTERPADTPRLIAVTVDCVDLEGMLTFWSELLSMEGELHEPFGFIQRPGAVSVWLQRVPEPRTGKNRLHLDLVVEDLPALEQRVQALGGGLDGMHEWQGFRWRTCTDPEGNLFDVMQAQAPE